MEWRTRFNQNVLNGAEDYIQSSPVQDLRIEENHVTARVIDIEDYDVDIRLSKDTVSSMKCNCPCAIAGGNCVERNLFLERTRWFIESAKP